MREITDEKLDKYFDITGQALNKAKENITKDSSKKGSAADFLDMAQRYYDDAKYFKEKDDYVNAFAALSYAHGWLDAGARIKLFDVHDSKLFTVDD
ncbi:DUF357 domain-containing protein [Candidatus Woesearchaeota archaeon CG_4_10_14_0_2_um_filter_33_10]|nr:MAG: hypothetical protein COV14_02670 [Candidatus Woesearchaeota archaeon CG10_big_fil_rev_8_21_14_0_10_33_12]PIU72178.1 MAG: DUF357 domain-containing protein [Candidatus Woesearchaeota archaeon CG06_land_8_20_14_3_00_33_13]PIZ51847.1 MAG: DUF357 domain-containing protein [Candidatus Woesearchaeota archaeon CG_4_10_14_0_2_um_filter_33_10]